MNTNHTTLANLATMRLPELQTLFAEITGETTRCPNKAFLIRRITEAVEAAQGEAVEAAQGEAVEGEAVEGEAVEGEAVEGEAVEGEAVEAAQEAESVEVDVEAVGAPQGEAVARRRREPVDMMVLPLRMEREVVAAMDAAWNRLGFRSRTEFLKAAIVASLRDAGETEVADLV